MAKNHRVAYDTRGRNSSVASGTFLMLLVLILGALVVASLSGCRPTLSPMSPEDIRPGMEIIVQERHYHVHILHDIGDGITVPLRGNLEVRPGDRLYVLAGPFADNRTDGFVGTSIGDLHDTEPAVVLKMTRGTSGYTDTVLMNLWAFIHLEAAARQAASETR